MTPQDQTSQPDRLWRVLTWSFALLLALIVAHDVDHIANQDITGNLSAAFWVFLPFQYAAFALVVALVLRRDSRAASMTALVCVVAILAFTGAHLLSAGPLAYSDYDLPAISWVLVFVPMAVAAFTLAVALRLRTGGSAPIAPPAA